MLSTEHWFNFFVRAGVKTCEREKKLELPKMCLIFLVNAISILLKNSIETPE